jgi:hypothetical protein
MYKETLWAKKLVAIATPYFFFPGVSRYLKILGGSRIHAGGTALAGADGRRCCGSG